MVLRRVAAAVSVRRLFVVYSCHQPNLFRGLDTGCAAHVHGNFSQFGLHFLILVLIVLRSGSPRSRTGATLGSRSELRRLVDSTGIHEAVRGILRGSNVRRDALQASRPEFGGTSGADRRARSHT